MYYEKYLDTTKVNVGLDAPANHRRMRLVPYQYLKGKSIAERSQLANFLAKYYSVAIRLSSKGGKLRMYAIDGDRKPSKAELDVMCQFAKGWAKANGVRLVLNADGTVVSDDGARFNSPVEAAIRYGGSRDEL